MRRALIFAVSILCSTVFGQSTWTGATSSVWNVAGNWMGAVPNSGIDAVVPAGTPNSPSTNGVATAGCRTLTVNSGATLTVASGFPLAVSQDLVVNGTISGTGAVRFVGPTLGNWSGSGSAGAVEIAKTGASVTVNTNTIVGTLTQTSGTFIVAGNAGVTVAVGGSATFQGGALGVFHVGTIDVAGNVTFSGTSVTSTTPAIRCGGNFTADASFAPTSAVLVMDKAGSQTIGGTFAALIDLTIAAGSSTSVSALVVNGVLTVDGTLAVTGALDANGNVNVNSGATLDLGGGTDTFGASLVVSGTLANPGTVVFDGGNAGAFAGATTLPTVQIAKTGGSQFTANSNMTIAGNLTQTSGTFTVAGNAGVTVAVGGNALFQGGALNVFHVGTIDVAGNVTFAGTAVASTMPTIQCSGNFTADASFAPTSGVVVMDKAGSQTIGGTFAAMHELTIAAGSSTTASSLAVNALLTVSGTLGVSGALDANGNVDVGGALNVGAGTTFGASLTVNGTLTSSGTVVFDGAATGGFTGVATFAAVQIAKTGGSQFTANSNMPIAGNLTQTSGTFTVAGNAGVTVAVGGNALFQGGAINVFHIGTIDVAGNVTFAGTAVANTMPTIRCSGNFTADASFAPNSGLLVMDKVGSQTIAAVSALRDLTIAAGSSTTTSSLGVNGVLTVSGTLGVSGALDANGNVNVDVGAGLNVGAGTTFGASLAVNGTLTSSGTVVFDGAAVGSFAGVATFAAVQIAKTGSTQFTVDTNMTIVGNFTQTSGTLTVAGNPGVTVAVGGNALFQGGILNVFNIGVLDVAGNVTFAGTAMTGTMPTIQCSGNFTADASFAPTSGTLVMDKAGSQTIGGAFPALHELTIAAGSSTTASALAVNSQLTVNGTLAVSGALDANGSVVVVSGATLDLGGGTDTFASNLTVDGTLANPGTIVFDGAGSAVFSGSGTSTFPAVQIAKSGAAQFTPNTNMTIVGNLTQTSGTFTAAGNLGVTVAVGGNALFQGGVLNVFHIGTIDVAGNVTFAGTAVPSTMPTIQCSGNFTADSSFAPTSGTLELDGVSPTTFGPAVAGGTLGYANLTIKNGTRTMANDFTLAGGTFTVDSTGSFTIAGARHLRVNQASANAVNVDGTLTVSPNGELSMGPQTTMTVGSTGTLSVVGVAGQPSRITGEAGGGYALTVNGTLAASNFLVKEMGPGGMVVGLGATIAAAPNNLSNGTFDFRSGATAGSVLLDLRRQAPAADFQSLTFLNTPGAAGVFNVQTSSSGVPIAFTNYAGPFAGPSFENDPNGLVGWNLQASPPVGEFRVRLGAELVEVFWHAANNANITGYEVRHSSSATGPFTLVATQGVGVPGNGYVDAPLPANVPEWEAVYAVMTGGERMLFGVGTATPYSTNPPPNVYKVGGNGPFASIQAAINAATAPNSVVWVTPGTYSAFSIGSSAPQNLHIAGDGTGQVSVDTSSGPVVISNVSAGNGVELGGLSIGSASTGQPGVQVLSCAGVVVLDALTVACNGTQTAVSVSASPKVAIQRCAISGGTGLAVTNASHVGLSKGSLTSLQSTGSTIEMADLTPGAVSVTPAGSLVTRGGVMPNMIVNRFASMAHPQLMTIDAFPNAAYIPVASPSMAFTTMSGFEMPILIDPGYVFVFSAMMTDAAGHGLTPFEIEPALVLLGFTYVAQVVCVDPQTSTLRMSNMVTVTSMP